VSQTAAGDIVLTLNNDGGSVVISNAVGVSANEHLSEVRFADGTVWTWADVIAASEVGGDGDDTIQGVALRDILRTGNLITNGEFIHYDASHGFAQSWGWQAQGPIPGWTEKNGQDFILEDSGAAGVTTSDGQRWMWMRSRTVTQTV
jgi:hypothetical protein